ncbi:MAG: ABC transporter substrate-binding protein [Deltaproteobacteria bacterium]|nr:ABC transporter substrate-binding protein [Deltaproteobacteria bacterium]
MRKFEKDTKPDKPVHLDFISPGAIGNMPSWLLNKFHPWITASTRAIPAPDHLHEIHKLPPELKKFTLPLVPNTDFMHAWQAGGHPEHRYERKFTDLKFIANQSFGSPGIFTFDRDINTPQDFIGKKIGVARKESSNWIWTYALLNDAWDIYDKVKLVTCPTPKHGLGKLLNGEIDATMFGCFLMETIEGNGFSTMPGLENFKGKRINWISISLEDVEKINKANPWKTGRVLMPKGSIRAEGPEALDPEEDIGLVGFTDALCGWDSTDDAVVYELLKFMDEKSALWPEVSGGRPMSLARMSRFPGLTEDMVHPAALRYYKEKGISIGGQVKLRRMG